MGEPEKSTKEFLKDFFEKYQGRLFETYRNWHLYLNHLFTQEAFLQTLEEVLGKVTNPEERRFKTGQVAKNLVANANSTPEFLLGLFRRFGKNRLYMDFLYQVAQEMVVKGLPFNTYNEVRAFYDWNRYSQHPLAALPLYLTSLETNLGKSHLHLYNELGGSLQGPQKEYLNRSTGTLEDLKQIITVMVFWNGPIEARIFEFNQPVTPDDLHGSLLLAVDLECLKDTPLDKIHVEPADAASALDHLYGCSANATYFYDYDAGTNRLRAWESLAGLVGYSGPSLPSPELIALAEQTTWLMFVAENAWFEGYWMDFGLAALRPNGTQLAVLAGSDSD